ncbi:MAG: TonB-dependent receptor, partial [Syntrophobacteraceae bacterium]
LKLIYGEAFRAPNVYELYYNDGETVKAALSLEPEKVHTYEAVWEQYIGDHHRMTSSIYYFTVNNLINLQQDTDGFLVFRNMDRVNAYGFEWEFESKWKCGIESRLSYAFQQARNDLDDSILTNSPFHQGKLNIIFPLYRDRVLLGTEFQYMSPRKTLAGQKTDNVFLTNLTLFTQKFMSGMEVSATVYNIFNQKYGDPGSEEHLQDILYQDGINFRVKVTYSF